MNKGNMVIYKLYFIYMFFVTIKQCINFIYLAIKYNNINVLPMVIKFQFGIYYDLWIRTTKDKGALKV